MEDTVTYEQELEQQDPIPKPKKLKVKDFAAKIKAKYPDYKDMDDTELTNRIVKKYPEYKDQVDLTPEPLKKKGTIGFEESSLQAGNALSQSGGVGGEEIPQIEMYTLPNGEMVETDPVSISRKYKELKDRKKSVTEGVGSSFGMGTGTTKEVEDEESQKSAKKLAEDFKGLDIEGINDDTQGLSDDLLRIYKNDILPDREQNNQLYQRKLSNIKWRSSFEKKLLNDVDNGNITPDNYNRIKHGIEYLPTATGQGDYSNQRNAVKSLAADIREYGGENKDQLLKDFAVEVSKVYGNPDNKAEEKFKDSPESKYLNPDAQLGYQYLQDVSPDKAEQYKRLFIDPKSLKDNPDELRGYNHLMQTLEETGINLKQNAVTEELNSLNNQAKQNGGLSPEQIERATKLEKVNEDLSAKRNELDSKYPDRIGDKIEDAVQEVMGQRISGFNYAGGKAFNAIRNTAQGVWEAASTPFMSDESNTLRELAIMGQSLEDEKIYHKTDKNKSLQYDTMVIKPELQKQVDLIKNNNLLTDDQKEQKLYNLFRENTDKFGRVPIKGGKFNISPSSIMYGMTDLGTSLLPFVAIEAATGGIGGAGAGAKFLRTFTAAAASTFHDEYAAALMEGKSQSEAYRSAMASTAINSLAMAGAGTPTEIRAMANPKTSAGKLIQSMSDDAIESVLKKGTPKGLKAVAQNVKERLKATPEMFKQGVKTGAKFEAYMGAANAINGREQDFKRSLLAIGEFGILGAALGQASFKTPTQLQKSAGLEFGKKPDEYIAIAESMKKDGLLTDAQLEQRIELIKNYGEAYKSIPKNLDEKQQREYLYQTVIKNEASKGKSNLPPKQAAEAEHKAMVADYMREIILDEPTEKQLESRKSYLEKQLEKKDEEGKLVLDEKEAAKVKAQIEAIDSHLDTTKKEVKEEELPDLSQPIPELNVDNKGIPLTEIAPEEIQRQMQPITDRMAEIEREFENKGFKIDWDYDNEIQVTDKKGNQLEAEEIPTELHKIAAEYEKATSKLGEFSQSDFVKSLEQSRKRSMGEEVPFEEVGQNQIGKPTDVVVVDAEQQSGKDVVDEGVGKGGDVDKPINWSKERLDKEIEKLDPYESQGYGVTRNQSLKESMVDFPDKARLAFELRDFFKRMYNKDFEKDFGKRPLSSLSQFFYTSAKSLKEWVGEQIKGIEGNIESNKKYIESLSNSKSDQKSKEMWSDTIEKSKKEIEKLRAEFEKYEQEKSGIDKKGDNVGISSKNSIIEQNKEATDFGKVISASSRFRPAETVVFDKPIIGKNGNKLISYQWAYEWTMQPSGKDTELKSKRISDWTQAESSAETGRDIVHKFTVERKDGAIVTVSSETIPSLLGYVDAAEMKNLPSVVSSVKTLAKQRMQLAILKAQESEYNNIKQEVEKGSKPDITVATKEELPFVTRKMIDSGRLDPNEFTYFKMGDETYRQDGNSKKPTKETIEQLTDSWVKKEVENKGGKKPSGLYDLERRIERQEKKVEQVTGSKLTSVEQSLSTKPEIKNEEPQVKIPIPKEEGGITETKTGQGVPETAEVAEPFVEEKRTILSHRGLQEVATEFGFGDVTSREVKTDPQLFKDAENTSKKWVENGVYEQKINSLVEKAENAEILTDEQRVILQQHIANVRGEMSGMDINSPEYNTKLSELNRLIRAGERTRSAAGAALRVPFMASVPNDLPTMLVEEMNISKVSELTPEQKATVQKEYTDISTAEKVYQQKIEALEAENAKLRAGRKVAESKSTSQRIKKTSEDFAKEREDIKKSIADKWNKAKNVGIVADPKNDLLIQIAPDVAKLVKSYVEEGVSKLEDIVAKVHDELKGFIPDLKEKDIHNIIAGDYNKKLPTKNQIAEQIENIRIQAKLVNKLESLLAGEEPKNEKRKIQRNAEIESLRQQIKEFKKEKLTPDQQALKALKTKMQKESESLKEQLRTGDYGKPEKKEPIKLDAEALKMRDELIKLRQNREVRLMLQQRMNETRGQSALRLTAEVFNIPRTLMTIGDYSGLLRQNIFFSAGHPIMSAAASKEMFKAGWSQTMYDRWFADLKDSPRYPIIEKSRLAIADSLSHDLTKREENFMSSLSEKIPLIGKTIVKGSERSYTALLNKMRVDMFNYFADSMEARGLTYENSPKVYDAMAEYINNATGRSDFGETLNRVAPVLNAAFFSPRLIASRVNMLTYWAQPRFWKTLPREVKIDYFRNWISLLAVGGTLMAIAKMGGADVEDDPRSSDFGKIKSGNTRWDIWGGAQPYVRVVAQVATGKRKSTNTGKMYDLNGDDIFGETKAGVITDFGRNKLAPVPGAVVDILSGRTGIGDKIVYQWGGAGENEISLDQYVKQRLLPMTITGVQEAMKDQGVKALLTVGVPSTFGVGTQTYEKPAPKSKKPTKKAKSKKPEK